MSPKNLTNKTSYDLLSTSAKRLLDEIEELDNTRLNEPAQTTTEQIPSYYIPSKLNLNYYEEMSKYQQQAISDEHRIELLEEYIEDLGQTLNHLKERLDCVDKSKEI